MPSVLVAAVVWAHLARWAAARVQVRASASSTASVGCLAAKFIVDGMTQSPSQWEAQAWGCSLLSGCVASTSKASQSMAGAAGALEAAVAAMQAFPDSKAVQRTCSTALGVAILFNRENGLRAGRLGALNLTLAAYERWMDDPIMGTMGGDIGCYFDFVDENRALVRKLGGIELLIQHIKDNFHGRHSDWAYEVVKNSLYGLSSSCWSNQDICFNEGFPQLAVQLMTEHPGETKIAEEALQVVKALMFYSEEYRHNLTSGGLPQALVTVLRENPLDRGAVSLACESIVGMVGPTVMVSQSFKPRFLSKKAFDAQAQALATEAGAVEQLVATLTEQGERHHVDHVFNFDIDAVYNADALCLQALIAVTHKSKENMDTVLGSDLVGSLAAQLEAGSLDLQSRVQACLLLGSLGSHDSKALKAAGAPFPACAR